VPDIDPALQAYYAARAPYYDAVYAKPERQADIAFLRQLLGERFARRTVLEVACGTGYWTPNIAKVASSVVATDALTEPVEFARLRPGNEHVRFRQVDAYALPADLGRFDAGFAGLWLSHVPVSRRAEFLTSLHACLLPGASVVLIDNSEVQCIELPIVERDADGNTYQHRPLRDGSLHRVLKNFPTEAELTSMIRGHGKHPRYELLSNFWLFEYVVSGDT